MTEGTFPKIDGDIFYSTEANLLKSYQIYSGNGADISVGSATAWTIGSYVFNCFNPQYTKVGSYLHWEIIAEVYGGYDGTPNYRDVYIKLLSAPSGTTPAFTTNYSKLFRGSQDVSIYLPLNFTYITPLTDEMRVSGVIPMLLTSGNSMGGAGATFTNTMMKVSII
jgi:hypothetical protein